MTADRTTRERELLALLGERVRAARTERGMTARAVAEKAGLSLRFYSSLEAGEANIAYTRLWAVARALELEPSAWLAGALAGKPRQVVGVLALLGLRGAGKSTVGPMIAQRLGIDFVELDEVIEAGAGMSIADLFAMHGEELYRRLAREAVRDLLDRERPCVAALPGGIVLDNGAWSMLQQRATTAWLKARPKDHMARVLDQGDRRPMANRADAMDELRTILARREPLYRQARIVVDTARGRAEDVASAVVAALPRAGWPGPTPKSG